MKPNCLIFLKLERLKQEKKDLHFHIICQKYVEPNLNLYIESYILNFCWALRKARFIDFKVWMTLCST